MKSDNFKIVDEYFIATGEPLGGGMYGKVYKGYIDSKGRKKKFYLRINKNFLNFYFYSKFFFIFKLKD
jgi:hypothetical protein